MLLGSTVLANVLINIVLPHFCLSWQYFLKAIVLYIFVLSWQWILGSIGLFNKLPLKVVIAMKFCDNQSVVWN